MDPKTFAETFENPTEPYVVVLEDAISLAADMHAGQLDKQGKPYIFHLLRVMFQMDTLEEQMVALLHDIVEDTCLTSEGLTNSWGFPEAVVAAIVCLTRVEGQTYAEHIKLCGSNPLSRKVKIEDLRDHLRENLHSNVLTNSHRDRYVDALAALVNDAH